MLTRCKCLHGFQWLLASCSIVGGAIAALEIRALAQITPDATLGTEGSRLTPNIQINGAAADRIQGGGLGGDLTVNASDAVEVVGITVDGQLSSELSAATAGAGDAGSLTINTRRLSV